MPPCNCEASWLEYLTAASLAAGIIGVILSLWYSRSGNFVAAWSTLVVPMQEDKMRAGRAFLRQLQAQSPGVPVPQNHWVAPSWWLPEYDLLKCAKAAYDHFDLAGIVVLNSRIPHLASTFVAEYGTSIIATWEQGARFLKERDREMVSDGQERARRREDLYDCFSVLYVMAVHRRSVATELSYPFYSWRDLLKLHRPRRVWTREARAAREVAIRSA